MTSLRIQAIDHIDEIEPALWDALLMSCGGSVMLQHAFLRAFETSASVTPGTGWQPSHLLVWASPSSSDATPACEQTTMTPSASEQLVGAIPLYAKGHSYGEFVFDWAWAEAYERHGLKYYPKWLCAVPFTPVPGPRLLTSPAYRSACAQALVQWAQQSKLSSLHVLYTNEQDTQALCDAGCMPRMHTQFHWFNHNWQSFDDFLAALTQPKRKKIRAERRKVTEAGITTKVLTGAALERADWDFFYRCYANTYHLRGNAPYLKPDFFDLVGKHLAQHCVMALAYRGAEPIAASLLWLDRAEGQQRLYGRYWGALEHIDCLHFELAYYTPIEWAIANKIDVIEGGAQGEHKLARGFIPVTTRSAHWLAHLGFADAVDRYLEQERAGMQNYTASLNSPFRPEVGD